MKQKLKSGMEVDAVTSWRRVLNWRAGQRKKVKRKLNKRFRKEWKQEHRK